MSRQPVPHYQYPSSMVPLPAPPNPWFHWADRLLYAGLGLAVLTIIPGLWLLTLFLVPCCLYLSWVAYVAGWPAGRLSGWGWARVALSALTAQLVVGWLLQGGYLGSALVCGTELLLGLAWQRGRQPQSQHCGPAQCWDCGC